MFYVEYLYNTVSADCSKLLEIQSWWFNNQKMSMFTPTLNLCFIAQVHKSLKSFIVSLQYIYNIFASQQRAPAHSLGATAARSPVQPFQAIHTPRKQYLLVRHFRKLLQPEQ